jgi:multidrug resistance efflux pump
MGTQTPPPASPPSPTQESGKGDKVRALTRVVLLVALVVFAWYLISDRLTPYTDQARIHTLVVPITPRVAGQLVEVNARLHERVPGGELLVLVDPRPYEIAVRQAEANVDLAFQQVGASGAGVKSATANLGVARASLDRAQKNYDRVQEVLSRNPGALSQADRDRTETSLDQARERVHSAEANLERAKEALGEEGARNAQVRAATSALEKAQLDLAFTRVVAPYEGVVESFTVDEGYFAAAGKPVGTFLSARDIWIQADFRENNLGRMEPGDRAEVVLDAAPGRVFRGTVRSLSYGVDEGVTNNPGGLPKVKGSSGWLRDPQRFPVVISLEDVPLGVTRAGGQADVVVHTGNHGPVDWIASLILRVRSLLSYVR